MSYHCHKVTDHKMPQKTNLKHRIKNVGSCPPHIANDQAVDHSNYDCCSDSSEVLSSSDEEDRWRETKPVADDLPPEYWAIQKLFRYVKSGNKITTMVSLCCLRDFDLSLQIHQMAIRDIGGIDILVNLLDSNYIKCRLCALHLLEICSSNIDVRKYIVDLHIVPCLVQLMRHPAIDLKIVAANVMRNVAKVRSARTEFRKLHAIPVLIDLLDIRIETIKKPENKLTDNEIEQMHLANAVCKALTELFVSQRNREIGRRYGLVPLVANILKSSDDKMIIAILALCQRCSVDVFFQLGLSTMGMISDIVQHLKSKNDEVKTKCCFALMECAIDRDIRNLIRSTTGLNCLVNALEESIASNADKLKEASTGAIWKCAKSTENIIELSNLSTFSVLMEILRSENNISTQVNVVGALAELLQLNSNRIVFRQAKGLNLMINFLSSINLSLLENTCRALEEYGKEAYAGKEMEDLNAVRLMWSLLRHPNTKIQIHAARSLCSYIGSAENAGVIIRSFVGGFQIIIALLKSKDIAVLAAICGLIAKIAMDLENLAILSDYGVIVLLAKLIHTDDDLLRENLAAAIASCAPYGRNIQEFGELRILMPLVGFLSSTNSSVHRTTSLALERLSTDIANCVTMHQCGVAPFLSELISTVDKLAQKSASKCLENIRNMALTAEKHAKNTIKFCK